ncbi:SDR family NAD(P)-dependent oxidoreductase [Nocardiopsis sp. L17-MgMaSL7]|uniref:SDR family NAD(P)-dependent oxidoreductase n=1 Tax=Nocardiopsis sp. L17-MgMaSL7 TaxID=1938893 RepID=UPI000D70CD6F|nr:SDR family NAD(P)-dependent oxidoreductase [Nocardiopsis sp. L17-MgMaSL7]PWV55372.1 NAD(P)-dependent dehydrogenase (short-subunit alcohol dehydrogenase family) [Nocardiopsis sp. L17-MgMaSL7]
MARLQDKVALVVGAGSVAPGWGNGRACAAIFAREGARVTAADISVGALEPTVELIRGEGGVVTPDTCDVTDAASVRRLVEATVEREGRVDVLVNVVGGSRHGGAAELSEEDWQRQIDLNLSSVYRTCHEVLPHMLRQGAGSIINIASTSGMRFTGSPQVAYASTKAGVIQFSKVSAAQYGPQGVRVNTVVPGQLHTPMVEARLAGQRTGGDVEKLLEQRQSRIPLGFMGDGRDTAYAALYLASDEARFVTGTEIVVDGGMTARCD